MKTNTATSPQLVVGANGIIGSALFARLKEQDYAVWGTTQRSHAISSSPPSSFFYLNLLDDPANWQFPHTTFDVAYLCAGICRMAQCEEDPEGTSKVNIDGMSKLAKRLSQQGTFIVYLSTNQVFSGETPYVAEDAPYQPRNEYGRQKAVMETFISNECQPAAVVRLTKVIEPQMPLIQQWIQQLRQQQTIDAFQDMMLAPVSLKQVVATLIRIGEKKQAGCYAVSGDKDVSYQEVANYLANHLNVSPHLVRSISGLNKGMKKIFLPPFTTMISSSTIALTGEKPPSFTDVLHACFDLNS